MPSAEMVKKVLAQIRKRTANHDYFFSQLNTPEWIEPLDKAGLFSAPPNAIRDGNSISFPFWPESQYLERVASDAPEQVAAIIMRIPETDNVRIHEDLARAATKFPAKLAAQWALKETAWIGRQEHLYFLLPESFGELFEYLASKGELQASLRLARAVLACKLIGGKSKRVSAKFDAWHYERMLQKHIPEVLRQARMKGFCLLCDTLNDMIVAESENDGDDDYSYIWRPAIEPHDQNHRNGELRDALIDAIRDGSRQIMLEGVGLDEIIHELTARRRPIFKRIALNLLVDNHSSPAAKEFACNRDNFLDVRLRHEYSRLLKVVFPDLDQDAKSLVLGWIDEGPLRAEGNENNDQELWRKQKAYWQAQRLSNLRGYLPEVWEKCYADIITELGEPEHPDFITYSASWSGPTSPKYTDELETMSADDIAFFLKNWEPSHEWNAPSPEGLGRVLQAVVAKSSDRFVTALDSFLKVDSTYARALVQGLEEAVKAGHTIEWTATIKYLSWIVEQPRDQERAPSGRMDYDPHWGWARKAAVSLLSKGIEKNLIDFSLRKPVWQLIDTISNDPDPATQDDEASTMDPATRSINTTRGEAMHAVMQYALWIYRSITEKDRKSESTSFDMNSILEVKECLERHLDPVAEPSPAIRAVFGQWFPWLLLLDSSWTKAKIKAIFPADCPVLWDAAWQTYIAFCPAYNEPFTALREQYSSAVDRLLLDSETKASWHDGHLGDHLMVMVGRGLIAWTDADSLVKRFFTNATLSEASNAVAFVGRSLLDSSPDVADVVNRFRTIWEQLTNFVIDEASDRTQLLKPFGWWFASKCFDSEWALEQLVRVIRITGGIEPDFMVMERLVELATAYPVRSLEVLRLLVRQDDQGRNVLGWKDSAHTMLKAALAVNETKELAQEIIHELGARGYIDFRELLKHS